MLFHCLNLCAHSLFFVFRVTFPLPLLKTWGIVHTFHTRQNNGSKKSARDKLDFSVPSQVRQIFRLLINRHFPVNPAQGSIIVITAGYNAHVSLLRYCTCTNALAGSVIHLWDVCRSICEFALSCVVVNMFKLLPASLRAETYVFVFQLFSYKSRVRLLYIIYSQSWVAAF